MTISFSTVWEVRTTGSDSNGGGFVAGASGTDRSQSNTAFVTVDGGTVTGTVQATTTDLLLTGYTVTAADVGNIYQSTGGTATTGAYQIMSVNTGTNTWTMDRSMGSSTQTSTGAMGGAFATLAKANSLKVSGNDVWVKAGTYSVNATLTESTGGADGSNITKWIGYQTVRGDYGTRPVVQASGTSFDMFNASADYIWLDNIEFDGNNQSGVAGPKMTGSVCMFRRLVVRNCLSGGIYVAAGRLVMDCEVVSCSGGAGQGGGIILASDSATVFRCVVTGCSNGVYTCQFGGGRAIQCLVRTSTAYGFLADFGPSAWFNCTAYNCGDSGFYVNVAQGIDAHNCIAVGCGSVGSNKGFDSQSTTRSFFLLNCSGYNNFNGNVGTNVPADSQEGFIALSATPFSDAAGGNFGLNNTIGGGRLLRGAGFPAGAWPALATSQSAPDVGAFQLSSTTNVGGISRSRVIGGV